MTGGTSSAKAVGLDAAARLVAEPDPAAAAFRAERHIRFRRPVAALASEGTAWPA